LRPDTVIQIGCNDLFTETSEGKAVPGQVLSFEEGTYVPHHVASGANLINLVWERQRRHEANGLGAAIRRLRRQRGLKLSDLGPLEKAVARIARGEVKRPQRRTIEAIADRVGTNPEELAQF